MMSDRVFLVCFPLVRVCFETFVRAGQPLWTPLSDWQVSQHLAFKGSVGVGRWEGGVLLKVEWCMQLCYPLLHVGSFLLPLTVDEFKTDVSPGVLDWVGLSYKTPCSLVGSLCLHFFRVEQLPAHHLLLPVSYRIKLSMNKVCHGYYWNTTSLKLYRIWSPSLRMCANRRLESWSLREAPLPEPQRLRPPRDAVRPPEPRSRPLPGWLAHLYLLPPAPTGPVWSSEKPRDLGSSVLRRVYLLFKRVFCPWRLRSENFTGTSVASERVFVLWNLTSEPLKSSHDFLEEGHKPQMENYF